MSQTSPDGNEPTVPAKAHDHIDIIYPSGLKLALLMISIFIGMFLVSLVCLRLQAPVEDRLIISTAIPQITNEFDSLYAFFSIKATFLISILLFEAGSALCGAAPNSIAFILGRTIAGLGAGGILSGVMVVIVYAVPLHKRPKYQGIFGAVFGIASVTGPLMGGALTTNVTWRWCFYLNFPLGALVMMFTFFLLQVPGRPKIKIPLKDKLRQLNALGMLALVPGVICLCLALQWGGSTYAWSEGRIIALLVLAVVLLIVFALIQSGSRSKPHCPRASSFSAASPPASGPSVYYLPLWFQAIDGVSAVDSGIHLLPMVLSIVVTSIAIGQLVSRIGYYTPFLICGVCLTAVGAGLLTTLDIGTAAGKWIGFQIVYGVGLGSTSPMATSLMFFGQQLFGAIFTTVGQNVLDTQLAHRLAGIPGISPRLIQSTGATQLLDLVPAEDHAAALQAYNDSLRVCFQVGLTLACLSILGALTMEWRTVKKNLPPKKPDAERAAEEGNFGQKVAPADAEDTRTTSQTEAYTLERTEEKAETEQSNVKEMAA
ncbi:major facilitator superfamily domain-containing protein [Lipomyces kononenkoae]